MAMRIAELPLTGGRLPFDCSVTGFDPDWWCDGHAVYGRTYFSVFQDDVEVARAELDPSSLDLGEDLASAQINSVVKIEFFEVREGYRCSDVGRDAIELIAARYPGRWMLALSVEAGGFWQAIGWMEAASSSRASTPTFRYVRAPPTRD